MGDEMDPTTRRLVGNFDAQVWAEEFVQMVKTHPNIPTDTGIMLGWFANAIMAGYDEHAHQTEGLRGRYADVTPSRDTEAHGYADHRSIATCECGAVFEGDHEAEALALWAEHCEQLEP